MSWYSRTKASKLAAPGGPDGSPGAAMYITYPDEGEKFHWAPRTGGWDVPIRQVSRRAIGR
ncbi:hypothetical protein TBR22_A40300 [Luteitalea sp. TBR-22]|nr:hypothetical protein TBR22_A40300 [Luteitalea sp. TBR-22]